jgi:serine/threonine protein kinase/formylglycine-generating enzyme required for sulfatase activity
MQMTGDRFIQQLQNRFQFDDIQANYVREQISQGRDLQAILLSIGITEEQMNSISNLKPHHIMDHFSAHTTSETTMPQHFSKNQEASNPLPTTYSPIPKPPQNLPIQEAHASIYQSSAQLFQKTNTQNPAQTPSQTFYHTPPTTNHVLPHQQTPSNFSAHQNLNQPTGDIANLSTYSPPSHPSNSIGALQHDDVGVDHLISLLLDVSERFDIFEEIAHGAMGKIEAGWDRHLGRPVAIKTLKNDQAKDVVRMRFLEEAQVTGQLQHPNIVTVYELGRIRGNVAFVMRRVEGDSLKQIIYKLKKAYEQVSPHAHHSISIQNQEAIETIQKYTLSKRLRIFQQLCQAVAFAHSRGVIHRDIKPSNVMVGDYDDVVLLDWGLCKIIGKEIRSSRSTEERWHTMHGQIIGTPAYMSPEQAMGMIDQISFPTDVYGLGALLYHLLTLSPVFIGKSNREVVKKVLQNQPTPPSEKAPEQYIPKEIEAICLKCLEKKQEDRYADANELTKALQSYLEMGNLIPSSSDSISQIQKLKPLKINPQEIEASLFQYQGILEDLASVYDTLNQAQKQSWLNGDHQYIQYYWDAQQQLVKSKQQSEQLFAQLSQKLSYAIFESTDDKARQDLKEMYCALLGSRYEQAMIEGDWKSQIQAVQKLREYDSPLGELIQQGVGSLYIHVKANQAKVQLWHLVTENGRLKSVRPKLLRNTPLLLERVPAGQYVLTAEAPQLIPLETSLQVIAGLTTRFSVSLYHRHSVPNGFVHIPSGSFKIGSPNDFLYPPSEQALPDFFMAELPVLSAEYLQFLQELCISSPAEAKQRQPRRSDGRILWVWNDYGMIFLADGWTENMPVIGISIDDADHYCQWYSQKYQVQVRLPSEMEWEKAARGSDGRAFSWGDMWDPRFCAGPEMWEGTLPPEVQFASTDRSVYGVRDLVGGVREWTQAVDPDFPFAVVRGGSFLTDEANGRHLWRKAYLPKYRVCDDIGFRLLLVPQMDTRTVED